MPDENGYFTEAERDAYEPAPCEICGGAVRPSWELIKTIGGGGWWFGTVTCLTPERHRR